jgi:transcriptional regulator GlxA family with amidase domain
MILGIPVYEGVDSLDVFGPYEMFKWVPAKCGLEVYLVSADGCPVTTVNGVKFEVHGSFADYPELDVVWIPGGAPEALAKMMSSPESSFFNYLRQVAQKARWVCSVCEGALLAARAGLLDGHTVTTHWAFMSCLAQFADVSVADGHPRFVRSGNRLTGGGISSGLDEALELIKLLFGEDAATAVQLTTQYFPKPPVSVEIPAHPPACPIRWA